MDKDYGIEITMTMMKAEDMPKTPISLTREQQDRIFEACFCSEEMIDYYKTRELDDHKIRDLICGAPISLEKKAELMEPFKDNEWLGEMYENTREAIDALSLGENEFFIFSDYEYWDTINYKTLKRKNLIPSDEAFEAYLRYYDEKRESKPEADDYWQVLEKWHMDEFDYGDLLYTYHFLEGVPIYFTKHGEPENGFCRNSIFPYISIPFEKGDIVSMDCYPYVPIETALLLEDGFNKDGCNKCDMNILYRMQDGSWIGGHIYHSIWGPNLPLLSPLYRLKTFDDILGEDEDFLLTVQKFVKENETNGKKLSRKLYLTHKGKLHYSGVSKEKVLEFIEEIKNEQT